MSKILSDKIHNLTFNIIPHMSGFVNDKRKFNRYLTVKNPYINSIENFTKTVFNI